MSKSPMPIFSSAISAPGQPDLKAHILAAIATAVLPAATSALFLWLVPGGCDIRGDAAVYRWTCLFPGLLIPVPAAIALFLVAANLLNRRFGSRFPDGWLVTTVVAGLLAQVVLLGAYLLALDPAYRRIFLDELILIPQPFAAGAIAGVVFWAALHVRIPASLQQ